MPSIALLCGQFCRCKQLGDTHKKSDAATQKKQFARVRRNVRFWHLADMVLALSNVRFWG
jgi:hypothetical protein